MLYDVRFGTGAVVKNPADTGATGACEQKNIISLTFNRLQHSVLEQNDHPLQRLFYDKLPSVDFLS